MKKVISVVMTVCMIASLIITGFADSDIYIFADSDCITAEIPKAYANAEPKILGSDGTEIEFDYEYTNPTELKLKFTDSIDGVCKLVLAGEGVSKSVNFEVRNVFSSASMGLVIDKSECVTQNDCSDGISFTANEDASVTVYPKNFSEYMTGRCRLSYILRTDDEKYDLSSLIVSENEKYYDTKAKNFFYKLIPGKTAMRHTYDNENQYWDNVGESFINPDGSANRIDIIANDYMTAIYGNGRSILSSADNEKLPESGGIAWRIYVHAGKTYTIENIRLISVDAYDYDRTEKIYVDTSGDDDGSGSPEEPLKTIRQAFDAARRSDCYNVDIIINSGVYYFENKTTISGLNRNVRITADGKAVFTAERKLSADADDSVLDDDVLCRISNEARDKVIKITLPDELRDNFNLDKRKKQAQIPSLYQNGKKLSVSRWPDFDYNNIESVVNDGHSGNGGAVIGYESDNPAAWLTAGMMYMEHYGSNDWCREWSKIKQIDSVNKTIELEDGASYPFKHEKRWSAVNVLEEINLPGEYYTDFEEGVLYVYPFDGISDFSTDGSISAFFDIVSCNGLTFDGIEFCRNESDSIKISESSKNVVIKNCLFHDTGGVVIMGQNCSVADSVFYDMPGNCITVSGGDRETMESSGNVIRNNQISVLGSYRCGYGTEPCITVSGVDVRVTGNVIHGSAVSALQLNAANACEISGNEIYNVINASADAGAIYMGCDLGSYGNVISDNYIHDYNAKSSYITEGSTGVYIDDWFSGITVRNNVLGKTTDGADSRGIHLAGGRDNTVQDNFMFNLNNGIMAIDRFSAGYLMIPSEMKRRILANSLFAVETVGTAYGAEFPQVNVTRQEYLKAYDYPTLPVEGRTDDIDGFWRLFPKNNNISGNVCYAKDNLIYDSIIQSGYVADNEFYPAQIINHGGGDKVMYTGNAPISQFALISPRDGVINGKSSAKINWENAMNADEYNYEIAADSEFKQVVYCGTTISNGADIYGLDESTKYYVRVTARNLSSLNPSSKEAVLESYVSEICQSDGGILVSHTAPVGSYIVCALRDNDELKKVIIDLVDEGETIKKVSLDAGDAGIAEIYFWDRYSLRPLCRTMKYDLSAKDKLHGL